MFFIIDKMYELFSDVSITFGRLYWFEALLALYGYLRGRCNDKMIRQLYVQLALPYIFATWVGSITCPTMGIKCEALLV